MCIKAIKMQREGGLTIVEILVAMTIGLILLAGVAQLFMANRESFRLQESMAYVQENGRFAVEFITRDIRMAGFQGCLSLMANEPTVIADPPGGFDLSSMTALFGVDNTAAGIMIGTLPVDEGTDRFTVQFADAIDGVQLVGNMTAVNANIQLSSNPAGWEAGDYLMISDCENADIFRASNVSQGGTITIAHASNVNTSNNLSKPYGADAMMMTPRRYEYFISGGALYRNTDLLVEGIRDMQILYGVDLSGDRVPNTYVTANVIGNMAAAPMNWSNVMAVRINLLALGRVDGAVSQNLSVPYNYGTFNAPDQRLYKTFSTTIGLRNRLP